ncbi:MAG: hypothetical protein J0H09_03275 [Burkholderiales bacterium]|nr:hypothetical protein [Burkholderiales bacterium]
MKKYLLAAISSLALGASGALWAADATITISGGSNPGSTTYTLNSMQLDASGNVTLSVTAVGGGGGGTPTPTQKTLTVIQPTGGTISLSGVTLNGSTATATCTTGEDCPTVTATLTMSSGYNAGNWSGLCSGSAASTCTFTLNNSGSLSASTSQAGGGGGGTPANCPAAPAGTALTQTNAFVAAYPQVTVVPMTPASIASYRVTTANTSNILSSKVDVTRTAGMDPGKYVVVSDCPGSTAPVNANAKCAWAVADSRQNLVYTVTGNNMNTYKNQYCVVEQGGKEYFINVFNTDAAGNTTCAAGKCTFYLSIN